MQETLVRLFAEYRRRSSSRIRVPRSFRAIDRLAMDEHRLDRRVRLLLGRLASHGGGAARPDLAHRIAVWSGLQQSRRIAG